MSACSEAVSDDAKGVSDDKKAVLANKKWLSGGPREGVSLFVKYSGDEVCGLARRRTRDANRSGPEFAENQSFGEGGSQKRRAGTHETSRLF